MELTKAPDIDELIAQIVDKLGMAHINPGQITAFRSKGATARARARIYAMPRIWQEALNIKPHYCIEFLTQHFDHLSFDERIRVIIHELMHIPKTFSGALVPHRGRGHRHQVTAGTVEKLFKELKR
jgi:predicted metallopeptidase